MLVLLLGEIDLSVGAVSGLCAADHGRAEREARLVALPGHRRGASLAGAAIGLFQGLIFTRFGIPSFVVTLAGLLAWQGALLKVLGDTGTVNITDSDDHRAHRHVLLATRSAGSWRSVAIGGSSPPIARLGPPAPDRGRPAAAALALVVARIGAGDRAAAVIAAVAMLNADRGLPLAALILVGFVRDLPATSPRARASAATSTRSAATPRPRAAPASR